MNARDNAAGTTSVKAASYESIALAKIDLSQTPMQKLRRERFNKEALKELAQSIGEHGVLQPILVRRLGDRYELVAGERRYLATRSAGLPAIPAVARDLTDLQVVSMQVIENAQREDLHPLIEAEGFEQLMKTHKLRAEDIAARIGKSRSHVYGVLKYCDLCPEARRAFFDGKLNPSTALLVARIGHHDTQRAAMKDITEGEAAWNGRRDGEPMSYREAHKHILHNYMLRLKAAPFDVKDAQLLPKAGTCEACPKRTGNQRELFGDVKDTDVCTDPKCFDDKRQAHYSVARRKLEAEGHKVIHGAEAKKIMPHWDTPVNTYSHNQLAGGYVKLDDTTYASGRSRKVAEVLGDDYKPILLEDPGTGKIIKVATQQAINAAVARNKPKASASRSAAKPKPAGPDIDALTTAEVYRQLREKVPAKWDVKILRQHLLRVLDFDWNDGGDIIAPLLGVKANTWRVPPAARKQIEKLKEGELARLMVLMAIGDQDSRGNDKEVAAMAVKYGVDVAAVRKKVEAEVKAKAEAAKGKGGKKIAAAAKTHAKKNPVKKKK